MAILFSTVLLAKTNGAVTLASDKHALKKMVLTAKCGKIHANLNARSHKYVQDRCHQ